MNEPNSVIVDYPFITGRSTPDSVRTGQKLIEVLDGDPRLRRWEWCQPHRMGQRTLVSSTSGEAHARADRSS